jgi:hypothetical protein
MKMFIRLILTTAIFGVTACEADRQYEDYKIESIADLILSETTHPHGFGKTECFVCHLPQNIHQVDRLNAPSFPSAASEVAKNGLASCRGCHGTNGVP